MKKILVLILITMLGITGCSNTNVTPVKLKDLDKTIVPAAKQYEGNAPVRIAVSSILSPKETLTVYEPLLKYLGDKLNIEVVLLQRRTYKEVNDLLQNGGADFAFVCSGGYIAGKQDFSMELLAKPKVQGNTAYQSYIIVKQGDAAASIMELRGRTFAFTDPMSFSGRIAPVYMLYSQGADSSQFFSRTFFTYSHDNAIKAVHDGIADGAAVDSMIYDRAVEIDPALKNKIKVIDRSLSVGNPPVVASHHADRVLKKKVQDILLNMHQEEQGRRALEALMYDQFVFPGEEAYAVLQEMWLAVKEKL